MTSTASFTSVAPTGSISLNQGGGVDKKKDGIGLEACMITNSSTCGLERTYLLNAEYSDKRVVERILWVLGLIEVGFSLKSPCNIVTLDPNLHFAWDKLGFLALTCSKDTLQKLSKLLDEQNAKYDQFPGQYLRYFDRTLPPFVDATYELVVLQPDQLFPRGHPLTVSTQDEHGLLHPKLYAPSADGALRVLGNPNFGVPPASLDAFSTQSVGCHDAWKYAALDSSPALPPFAASHRPWLLSEKRPATLNPFFAILNADIVFRRYLSIEGRKPLCADYQELVRLTIEVAGKIYHGPVVVDAFECSEVTRQAKKDYEAIRRGEEGHLRRAAAYTYRLGFEVDEPDPDASPKQISDYFRFLMSRRDQPLTQKELVYLASVEGTTTVDLDDEETDSDESDFSNDDEETNVPGMQDTQVGPQPAVNGPVWALC